GALFGLCTALVYAWLLLDLLTRWWPGGLQGSFLRLHVSASSLVIGYIAAVFTSVVTIAWTVRGLRRVPPTTLLRGETTPMSHAPSHRSAKFGWSMWIAAIASVGGIGLLGG